MFGYYSEMLDELQKVTGEVYFKDAIFGVLAGVSFTLFTVFAVNA